MSQYSPRSTIVTPATFRAMRGTRTTSLAAKAHAKTHAYNLDAAQRELDQRNAEGEDVSHLYVCQTSARIIDTTLAPLFDSERGIRSC